MDFNKIEQKWQGKWAEKKIFEANATTTKKFFLNFPYPYINAYQHIGHLYTLMRVDAFARYKRLKGYNVLFPQGWHITGSPIVNAAKRIQEKEPKQVKIMKDMGFDDKQIKKFEKPEYWVEFFAPEFKKDYIRMGMSIDWRREFHTTSMNPHYNKFIIWQFNKLKEKGYIIKGKFPVVWDPKDKCAAGDHDRIEGEGEVPQEFYLFKFALDDNRKIITATLRHDTIWGITNVYVNPKVNYVEIETKGEKWIVGEPIIKKLENQDYQVKVIRKIKGLELVGKKVESFGGGKILVLPATFLDPEYGTGMVHSVPSDSADDLIALQDLQKNDEVIKKYGLNAEEVKSIKPIEIFNTPEVGGNSAQYFIDKYKVKSQNEREKLEKIKKELYKLTFSKSTFGPLYKKGFSQSLEGMTIPQGQEIIKRDLLKQEKIAIFYELTGKVVSRSLTECIVKIVDDQWFIDYANPKWKKLAHECLDQMTLYPEKVRAQFDYVIDWLHEWACTRKEGLGTRLPWDEKWLIESLSDSTIYMAYYTIAHIIKDIDAEKLDDNFFDYVLLGKGKADNLQVEKKKTEEMKKEFEYWYPVDFRNSGKDLIQNHLTFFIFNHTAIFPKDKWPKGIGANGWVMVDGKKMSKSLGNMIPVRKVAAEFSADASRFTILAGGEELDDPNWETEMAKSMIIKLKQLHETSKKHYGKGVTEKKSIDEWAESELNRIVKEATEYMEKTLFRSAINKIYFEMQNTTKWYLKRSNDKPNKKIMDSIIEAQLIMLSPFTPHMCEEIWEALGKKGFVSTAEWPKYDEKKIQETNNEEYIRDLISDIRSVLKLAKVKKPKKITLFISPKWKYELFEFLNQKTEETKNIGELIKEVMKTDLRKHGQEITKMLPRTIKTTIPKIKMGTEEKTLKESQKYFETEFSCKVSIVKAEESKETKAKQATPGKPAIIVG